ncbi:hypothetical protein ACFSZS_24555 [Seohaeicola zhoushanensis]
MELAKAEAHDPEAETARNDAAYRAQIAYLFENSPFYREKLTNAGFADAGAVGGLADIAQLPFTTKDELRESRTKENAIGGHLAAPLGEIVRIYSTSGTTGTPSYIPLTRPDLANWVEISSRSSPPPGRGRDIGSFRPIMPAPSWQASRWTPSPHLASVTYRSALETPSG